MTGRKRASRSDSSALEESLRGVRSKDMRDAIAKDARIDLRISQRDKEVVLRAAKACNMTTSEFVVKCSLFVAGKLIATTDT